MKANVFFSDALTGEKIDGSIAKLTLFGELNDKDGEKVFRKISSFCKKNPHVKGYIFDFEEVECLNAKSVGNLMTLDAIIRKNGGKIVIARPLSDVQLFFQQVGIDRKIEICASVEEAKSLLVENIEE